MVEIIGKGMHHVGVMTSLPVDLITAGAPCENIEVLVRVKRDVMLDRFLADRFECMVADETSGEGLEALFEIIGIHHLAELLDGIGRLYEQYAVFLFQAGIFRQYDAALMTCRNEDPHAFVRICRIEPAHAHELAQLAEHAVADECLSHLLRKPGEHVQKQEQAIGVPFEEDDAVMKPLYRIDQLSR